MTAGLAVVADRTSDLKSADQNWSKAGEAKNLDQLMSFVADDVYASGPDGKWTQGKATMRYDWSRMLADATVKLTWTVNAAAVSKDRRFGYTRATFQGSMGGKPMSAGTPQYGRKEKDEKWKVVVDIAWGRVTRPELVSQIAQVAMNEMPWRWCG